MHTFRRLSWRRRTLLFQALVWLWAVRVALWVLPYRAWSRLFLDARVIRSRAVRPSRSLQDDVPWAIHGASRLVPRATCLVRALAGRCLLRQHGCDSRLRIGVRRSARAAFEAHAWLEREGAVLLGGRDLERYFPFPPEGRP